MTEPDLTNAALPREPTDRLTGLSAVQLAQRIAAREVSCREVMLAYLAQIDRFNPAVNALVALQPHEQLLAQADARDGRIARGESLGWMHGFPAAPKDLASVAGLATTLGSPLFKHQVPKADSVSVARMRESGAIFIGRSNTPELGLGSHTYNPLYGTTGNAFDPTKSAGGSSGGAAVALALDMLPVADGSDMMGSLRNPAGWNNVFGFRPSLGRVPFGPNPEVFINQFSTDGPMGRSVADVAMLLSVQAGPDARIPLSLTDDPAQFTQRLDRSFDGVRIGWMGDFGGYLPTEPGVLELCALSLDTFKTIGGTIDAAQPVFQMDRLWRAWITLRSFQVAGVYGAHYADPKRRALLKLEAQGEIEQGLGLTGADVYRASTERSAWYQALMALFERFDFLALPSAQIFPFDAKLDWPHQIGDRVMDTYHRWMEVVIGPTMAGLPTLSVPAGFNADGLPIGLQLIGPPRADFSVLQLGHAYEQLCGHLQMRSPLLAPGATLQPMAAFNEPAAKRSTTQTSPP